MKTINKLFLIFTFLCFIYSCTDDDTLISNGSVMEESNRDDYYQMRGYGDSIPSDSLRELVRLDSIRIAESNHRNK
jgi:hypothetical protein